MRAFNSPIRKGEISKVQQSNKVTQYVSIVHNKLVYDWTYQYCDYPYVYIYYVVVFYIDRSYQLVGYKKKTILQNGSLSYITDTKYSRLKPNIKRRVAVRYQQS
jgi:hypothetical protein